MSVRNDKLSGIVTGVTGAAMFGFGVFGLLIVFAQHLMISATGHQGAAPPEPFIRMMQATHAIFVTYLPLMAIGGIVFTVSGFYIWRGNNIARRIAQANAILGYAWGTAYTFSSYPIMQQMEMHNPLVGPEFKWFSLITGVIFLIAVPTALLYILSRPSVTEAPPSEKA